MQDFRQDPRARARDAGLARLRRTTRFSIFGATALAGAFAGVAAHSSPGHKSRAAAAPAATRRTANASARRVRPARHLAPAQTQAAAPTPAPPPAPPPAPVTTTVAPVATTGTS
jgi:hypothetical protein